ncbi:MAG: anti-sigma regulatory factor [Candidatus Omnitrophica bacterium]|nr:MAG: Serine-protein kinase RsbW [Candidatus Hinthialibacteria bacterium OLB16]MBE7487760.1 ATP-binding protein [bacterium]MBV6481942.1 Serine-protein kinase RsbW [bacterium]MCE7908906.1 ATP-binding protein [Candidatus Omnitrophica bacterium COP1]MCL4735659.1 anti-sigma regulatory factor [Candidatus Omnitrophota bacterium]
MPSSIRLPLARKSPQKTASELHGEKSLTDPQMDLFEFRVPAKAQFIYPIRELIGDLARQLGFPDHEADMIVLAVDEALANSVSHSSHHKEPVEVCLQLNDDSLEITVRDNGSEYFERFLQPLALEEHLREMRETGLGLHIIKTVMDSVEYIRTDDCRNILTLVKFLHRA